MWNLLSNSLNDTMKALPLVWWRVALLSLLPMVLLLVGAAVVEPLMNLLMGENALESAAVSAAMGGAIDGRLIGFAALFFVLFFAFALLVQIANLYIIKHGLRGEVLSPLTALGHAPVKFFPFLWLQIRSAWYMFWRFFLVALAIVVPLGIIMGVMSGSADAQALDPAVVEQLSTMQEAGFDPAVIQQLIDAQGGELDPEILQAFQRNELVAQNSFGAESASLIMAFEQMGGFAFGFFFLLLFFGTFIFIAVPVFLFQPYFIEKNTTVAQAMAATKTAVTGNRWKLFGVFACFFIPYLAISMGISLGATALSASLPGSVAIILEVVSMVISILLAVIPAVFLYALANRLAKQGENEYTSVDTSE